MSNPPANVAALGFDPQALRKKYREERDKRVRADGNEQYIEPKGDFAHYLDDPYIEKKIERGPMEVDTSVLVIGGGFSGLLAGARLRENGVDDFRIIEKAGDFGGTWYWNRYPGAACDTESYIYMPLLEETGYMPVAKYARAPELLEHSRRIGRHFGLYDKAIFQTDRIVTSPGYVSTTQDGIVDYDGAQWLGINNATKGVSSLVVGNSAASGNSLNQYGNDVDIQDGNLNVRNAGTADWHKVTYSFRSPANYGAGRIDLIWNLAAGESAWIDDVSLCQGTCP